MIRPALLALLLIGAPAAAADLRDYCPDRPGRLTPACIVDPGHVSVEVGAADLTHHRFTGGVDDMLAVADTAVRAGITDRLELLAQWSLYNRVRSRAGGMVTTTTGVGDVLLGLKQSFVHPDGKGVSVALQPFVTAPAAKDVIGAGKWTEGLIVPITVELPADVQLGLSPEIDRLPNAEHGFHASYTMIAGLSRAFGTVTPGFEIAAVHDDDPGNRTTQVTADVFASYIPKASPNLQFDGGAYVGLNRDTPDVEVFVGVARRF